MAKATGTRKLPSRMTVGTRLVLSVTKVTTTLATHSSRPTTKTRSHWRPSRSRVAVPIAWSVMGASLPGSASMIDDRPTLDKSMARVRPGDPRRTISRSGRPLAGGDFHRDVHHGHLGHPRLGGHRLPQPLAHVGRG